MKSNLEKYKTLDNYLKSNIIIDTITNCWNWTKVKDQDGYGRANWNKNRWLVAHRLSYITFKGPIPVDKPLICHTCDNPACINPEHLWCGTPLDNMRDKINKGRDPTPYKFKGEKSVTSKLTDKQRDDIVNDTRVATIIAKEYHVDPALIYKLRKTWKR